MNRQCRFDNAAKEYLYTFYGILDEMIWCMTGAEQGESISCNFIMQMIPHHEGAVRMAENALCFPLCKELILILQSIITSQKRGIEQMRNLLRCMGC